MKYTANTWPIDTALLQDPGGRPTDLTTAAPEHWRPTLREVELAGFEHADLTDSWVWPGDLPSAGRRDLVQVASSVGLSVSNIAVTRRSVSDPDPDPDPDSRSAAGGQEPGLHPAHDRGGR